MTQYQILKRVTSGKITTITQAQRTNAYSDCRGRVSIHRETTGSLGHGSFVSCVSWFRHTTRSLASPP